MVRKVMAVCIALAVALSAAAHASAATAQIYEGNISTSMTAYFSDILLKVPPTLNYVLIRSGQYTYVMYVGEFSWDGSTFYATSADAYAITTNSGYNSVYSFNVSTISDLTIRPGDYLVYSDLGPFPGLREPVEVWGYLLLIALFILLLCNLIRPIFWR